MTATRSTARAAAAAMLLAGAAIALAGCGEHATRGAARGGGTGALAGAVGGAVSALVFGGDPLDAAARGAVYAGTTGAVYGGIAGSQADRQAAERDQARFEALRSEIGDEAFDGLEALASCNHVKSLSQAGKAKRSDNPNYALAGLWLEVVSHADAGNESQARVMLPTVVENDWNLNTEAEAEERLGKMITALQDIREEFGKPRTCTG